jgi:hypothetical protein
MAHQQPAKPVSNANVQVIPVEMGMLGMSLEDITSSTKGYVRLPVGPRDLTMAGGRKWVKLKVMAMEDVREFRDVIVGNEQGEVKEHTPVELSYELATGGYQRVGELNPLPVVSNQGVYDDFAWINFLTTDVQYIIGTNAHAADSAVPLFQATQIALWATNDCWVRFNGAKRVPHFIARIVPYTFPLKCTTIDVMLYVGTGYLFVHAVGVALST